MTSTFGGLSSALTGLNAARLGTSIAGQNIQNANTEGYTRQRVQTSALSSVANTGLFDAAPAAGQGVQTDAIARLGDSFLDARVRTTAGSAGYTAARATATAGIETTLREPGSEGLSSKLQDFWAGWQDLSNHPGESAPAGALLKAASAVTTSLAESYRGLEAQWNSTRAQTAWLVTEVNASAQGIAELNAQIRSSANAGASVNELVDRRSVLAEKVASLAGGTVRDAGDGTIEVIVGGNALVSGEKARLLTVTGPARFGDTGTVQLEWAHRPGIPASPDGGRIAGNVSVLAPADGAGQGGHIAEAAASLNAIATRIAGQVNIVHREGATTAGATGLDFFSTDPAVPAALGLKTIPLTAEGIASGKPGRGSLDGSIADRISQLGTGEASPDAGWSTVVTGIGVAARADNQSAELGLAAAEAAKGLQLSGSSVSLDEENVSLLAHQHAYQAAARVISAMDEMLDTLINQTGRVGR